MPFGLVSAPATFQTMMNGVLHDLEFVRVYIDDILIYSRTMDDHRRHVKTVLQRLREAGLTLRGKKCAFGKSEVQYLGHIFNGKGMSPDPRKTAAISNWITPKTIKEVQGFLGLTNYYRRFICNYAKIAAPLYNLTHQDQPFEWNVKAEGAFVRLKQMLCEAPLLRFPDLNETFFVTTDASNDAVGAILEQKDRIVSYASRVLKPAEKNYSVIEKECLALVFALKNFRHFLLGRKFLVYSDHRPLQWLSTKSDNSRLCRWSLALQEFDFEICYRPGKENQAADALSRKIYETCTMPVDYPVETEELIRAQKEDPIVNRLMQFKQNETKPSKEFKHREARALINSWNDLMVLDGLLKKKWYFEDGVEKKKFKWVPVIGESLRKRILNQFHDVPTAGHHGVEKTYGRMKTEVYWPFMYRDVLKYCKQCSVCQQEKLHTVKPSLKNIPNRKPWSTVAVDILEVPVSKHGNKYLVVYQDYFSKWPEVYCTKNQTAETIQETLYDYISRYGPPERIHSDLGPNFESKLVRDTLAFYGIQKSHTTAYHPQGNGMVERFNRSLLRLLRTFVEEENDWERFLAPLLYAYRTSKHATTGFSPYEVLFVREPPSIVNDKGSDWGFDLEDWRQLTERKRRMLMEKVVENTEKVQEYQKRHYDKTVGKIEELRIGDEVWLRNMKKVSKLSPKWNRGWFVHKILGEQNVVIQRADRTQQRVVHRVRIRKVISEDTDIENCLPRRVWISIENGNNTDGTPQREQTVNEEEHGTPQREQTVNEEEPRHDQSLPGHSGTQEQKEALHNRPARIRTQPKRFMFESFKKEERSCNN